MDTQSLYFLICRENAQNINGCITWNEFDLSQFIVEEEKYALLTFWW